MAGTNRCKQKRASCRLPVVVSSEEEHVPDHLSCRKDITLFASIVPLSAETPKLRLDSSSTMAMTNFEAVIRTSGIPTGMRPSAIYIRPYLLTTHRLRQAWLLTVHIYNPRTGTACERPDPPLAPSPLPVLWVSNVVILILRRQRHTEYMTKSRGIPPEGLRRSWSWFIYNRAR